MKNRILVKCADSTFHFSSKIAKYYRACVVYVFFLAKYFPSLVRCKKWLFPSLPFALTFSQIGQLFTFKGILQITRHLIVFDIICI